MVVVGFLLMVVAEWLSFLFNVDGGFFVYCDGWVFLFMAVTWFFC